MLLLGLRHIFVVVVAPFVSLVVLVAGAVLARLVVVVVVLAKFVVVAAVAKNLFKIFYLDYNSYRR